METGGSRWKKKLVGKTSWYKQRKRNSDEETQRQVGGKDRKRGKMDHHEKLKTRAVLFVPQTPLGEEDKRGPSKDGEPDKVQVEGGRESRHEPPEPPQPDIHLEGYTLWEGRVCALLSGGRGDPSMYQNQRGI